MDDFRIKISSELDLSKAKAEMQTFLNSYKNEKLKIDVEFDGLNGNGSFNKWEETGRKAGKVYSTAIQKQIEAVSKTQRNYFSEPLKNLTKMQKSYSDFWNKELNKPANKNYGKNQQMITFDEYLNQMKKQSEKVVQIQKRVSQGFLDVDTSSIKSTLKRYAGSDSTYFKDAENSYKRLVQLRKELSSGMDADGTLSDRGMIKKWEEYNNVLEKCKNQIKVLSNESKGLAKPFSQLDAVTAGNKTLTWLNNNSKAAKEYGEVLRQLAAQQKAATNSEDLANYNKQVKLIMSEAQSKGLTGKSSREEFTRAIRQIGEFAGVYGAIQNVVFEVPRQMVQAVKDVNAAQIELTKVSNASTLQLSNYWEEAAVSAKKYGSTISDVINNTADWSRLGYGLEDSKYLSDMTTLYQKVGDNMTQETASQNLISTLQGFQLDAKDAGSIIDKFNEVANNYAIDTQGIGEALQRSAASFNAANTDLSKSIALITGTNEVVQDPSRVGNMWKTVSMRIRSTKSELEEAGESTDGMLETTSELRDLIKSMTGFDIMADAAGTQFKDIYDIVVGIGEQWKNLNDVEQAGLLEKLAGKQQGNALAAALNNIDTIKSAYNTAMFESNGSAERELENYKKGIQYSLDTFKAQFQQLATTTIDSDIFKGVVDGGTTLISVLTEIIDVGNGIPALFATIGGIFSQKGLGKRNAGLYKIKQNNRRFINVEIFLA